MSKDAWAHAPWVKMALADLAAGVKEIKGPQDHPEIMRAFRICGHPEILHDETANCAAMLGKWLHDAGFPIPPVATNLMARSYLTYGKKLDRPVPGCIAVLPRGKPPFGHVCIVLEIVGDRMKYIGANQRDAVSELWTPVSAALPGGFRWPVKATVESLRDAGSTDIVTMEALQKGVIGSAALASTAKGAQETIAPDPGWVPQINIEGAADGLSQTQVAIEALNAIIRLVGANLWIIVLVACGAGIWWVSEKHKRRRVARAQQGQSLSVEVTHAA